MGAAKALGKLSDDLTAQMLLQHSTDASGDLIHDRQGAVRKAQISAIMSTSQPMMLANIFNVVALAALEQHVGLLTPDTLVWAAIVILFALYGLRSARRFANAPPRDTASQRAPGKMVLSSCVLALIWCYPLIIILPHGALIQVAFLSALSAGMIAGGALALYPIPLAGLLYTFILSAVAFTSVAFHGLLPILPFGIVIVSFAFVVIYSVRRHTRVFLSEVVGKLEAERQRDVVALLLDTFQGEGGRYLWRSDNQLNLKTELEPLYQMLGLASQGQLDPNLQNILSAAGASKHNADLAARFENLLSFNGAPSSSFEAIIKISRGCVVKLASRRDAGDSMATTGYHGYIKDVTAEVVANEKIYRLATRDAMTGLLNYPEFNKRAQTTLNGWKKGEFKALFMFIDADNLKSVNDNFGHAAGDALIKTMAKGLEEILPLPSLVARKGGDEFVALALVSTDTDELRWANSIINAINGSFYHGEVQIPISCCIGVSVVEATNTALRELELEADRALYRAKSTGKSRASIYDEAIGRQIHRDRLLANDIETAMRKHQLTVDFQAIVDLKTTAILGAEALVRWNHPTLGPINPEKIVSVAQSQGLGPTFLDYMLRMSSQHAMDWPNGFLSVNMNSADLQQGNLDRRVADIMDETGFPAERLWLEVTETELLLDSGDVQANLKALRRMGVKIALDDFGTGYSSLSYLSKYPTDVLKIDKTLVENLDTDHSSQIIVNAVRDLAKTNGFRLVAEGVETASIIHVLHKAGIEMAQGFAYFRPMAPTRFYRLLGRMAASNGADEILTSAQQRKKPVNNKTM